MNKSLPIGYIEIAGQRVEASETVIVNAVELWHLQQGGKDIRAAMDKLKAELLAGYRDLEPSAAIVIPGVCRVTLKRGAVKRVIRDIGAVRDLLGARFDDLVETRVAFGTTDKLDAMLDDAADTLGQALREHVSVVVGDPTVSVVAA